LIRHPLIIAPIGAQRQALLTERLPNTKGVWVYDLRANMDSFGKTRLLTVADFAPFEEAFGDSPLGKSPRKDEGNEGRFCFFTREQIAARNDNLDLVWMRDTSGDPEDEMTEPEEIADAIMIHLRTALEEIEALSEDVTPGAAEAAE
jgi:type I restriction enzyme M protein